ncbi:hypothetical protein FACS1894161_3460 [Spirochaetia bacterium]|nr:hypothetical protein FACS1894161_3460 [Spirochaetia bacterium]
MAKKRFYYFLVKNRDIKDWNQFELPNADDSIFIEEGSKKGFLDHQHLTDEELGNLNNVIKYRKGIYPKNGIVIDTTDDSPDGFEYDKRQNFDLREDGYYYINLSSAGSRGAKLERFVGEWIIKDSNGNIIDTIKIYPQNEPQTYQNHTWYRKKRIDDNDIFWYGTYVYLNNTVFLSLIEYDEALVSNTDYGILMLKQNIMNQSIYKLYSYRYDDSVDDKNVEYEFVSGSSDRYLNYNTQDAKGGDGQLYNEIVKFIRDNRGRIDISYQIGKGGATYPSDGGYSELRNIPIQLSGGPDYKVNDFGGQGGTFLYDYFGRIKHRESTPENGRLLINYIGTETTDTYSINVNNTPGISDFSFPTTSTAGTLITVKAKLIDENEIDYDESIIELKHDNGVLESIPFPEYIKRYEYGDGRWENRKITITQEPEYYDHYYYYIQTMTFVMPINNVEIKFKTKTKRYKLYVKQDQHIAKVEIESNDTVFELKRPVLNGEYMAVANFEANAGSEIKLTITYMDNEYLVNEDAFRYYLGLDSKNSVIFGTKNRRLEQIITFTMPKRHVIVRIDCDALFTLTIEQNERQIIDEKEKAEFSYGSYTERKIEKIIIRKFGEEVKSKDIPYTFQVKHYDIFDIYIKLSDIYMHLDKAHLYSIEPSLTIEEAGEFADYNPSGLPPRINPSQYPLPPDVMINKELYQHIRVRMPANSLTLDLKWEERFYQINLLIQSAFVKSIAIFDTNKVYDIFDTGEKEMLYQSNFPHNTYSIYINRPDNIVPNYVVPPIKTNNVSLLVKYQNSMMIEKNDSFYKRENSNKVSFVSIPTSQGPNWNPPIDPRIPYDNFILEGGGTSVSTYSNNNPKHIDSFKVSFDILKKDINIQVKLVFPPGIILEKHDYVSDGSFTLDEGRYRIFIGGGAGGNGADASEGAIYPYNERGQAGSYGKAAYFDIELEEITNLTYGVGGAGSHGTPNPRLKKNYTSGAGGGGGGSSYLTFDTLIRAIVNGSYKEFM